MIDYPSIAESIIKVEGLNFALASAYIMDDLPEARSLLRARIVAELRNAADDARRDLLAAAKNLMTAASDVHEFLSGASFEGWSEATEADIHREKLEQAITRATEAMK